MYKELPKGKYENNESKRKPREAKNIILLVLLSLLLFSLTFFRMERYKFNVEVGDIASEDIRAITEIEDKEASEKLKKDAENNVQERYRISPSVQIEMKNKVKNFTGKSRDLIKNKDMSRQEKLEDLGKVFNFEIPEELLSPMLDSTSDEIDQYENTLLDLINQLLSSGIKEEDLEYEKENLNYTFENLNLDSWEMELGILIFRNILKPNKFIDELETARIKEEAVDSVEPVIIRENEIIVAKGERIDSHKLDLIRESGLLKNAEGFGIKSSIGTIILIILAIVLMYLYIEEYNSEILEDRRYLAVVLIVFLVLIISEGVYSISPYLLPVSAGALLISVLVDPQLAIVINVIMSIYLGFLLRLDISIIYMLIVGGSLGVVKLEDQRERSNLIVNGIVIGLVNVLVITAFGLIKQSSLREIIIRDLQVFFNGIIAVIITIGSLPLWENMFNILTPVRLAELSNPNQPLIKKMLLEAPGTYHHSIIVGNLGEAAAEAIGANPLLTRVGAYYHDIGKMEKPYYFKENQFGMDNPHDKLSPTESAKIILRHPIAGYEMAMEHKLPEEIINFTLEHHGTTNVAYFYYEAKKSGEDVDIKDFTYTGPKPQSRETAIIMMADSVEAAVRSIEGPTRDNIEEMTRKVIRGKIEAGQMEECDITNRDIHLTEKAFVNVLMGIYHDRISYPEDDENEELKYSEEGEV